MASVSSASKWPEVIPVVDRIGAEAVGFYGGGPQVGVGTVFGGELDANT